MKLIDLSSTLSRLGFVQKSAIDSQTFLTPTFLFFHPTNFLMKPSTILDATSVRDRRRSTLDQLEDGTYGQMYAGLLLHLFWCLHPGKSQEPARTDQNKNHTLEIPQYLFSHRCWHFEGHSCLSRSTSCKYVGLDYRCFMGFAVCCSHFRLSLFHLLSVSSSWCFVVENECPTILPWLFQDDITSQITLLASPLALALVLFGESNNALNRCSQPDSIVFQQWHHSLLLVSTNLKLVSMRLLHEQYSKLGGRLETNP